VNLKGKVRVTVTDTKGVLRVLELNDVLYVPSLSRSLFSVPAFLRHPGNKVTSLKNSIIFILGGVVQASIPANNFANVTGAMATTTKGGNIVGAEGVPLKNLTEKLSHYSPSTPISPNIASTVLEIPTMDIAHAFHRKSADNVQEVCNNTLAIVQKKKIDVDILHR
jgi:predicted dinucleotide-binding enzyme